MLNEISQAEKDSYHGFTHMWNIRNSTQDHRRREGKLNGKKSERETSHERIWTLGNKLRVTEGMGVGGWGDQVMGIKEGICWEDHWVLYATNRSLNPTSKTNDVLYSG